MAPYSPAEGCAPSAWAADYTLDHGLRLERLAPVEAAAA